MLSVKHVFLDHQFFSYRIKVLTSIARRRFLSLISNLFIDTIRELQTMIPVFSLCVYL